MAQRIAALRNGTFRGLAVYINSKGEHDGTTKRYGLPDERKPDLSPAGISAV
jgi:hypothetical protein